MHCSRRKNAVAADASRVWWYFSTIRWLPVVMLVGVAVVDTLGKVGRDQASGWLFPLVCLLFALLLFQYGSILAHCHQPRQTGGIRQRTRERRGQNLFCRAGQGNNREGRFD